MSERWRDAQVNLCRDHITQATFRMDALRSSVERLPLPNRADIERELDRLRGLRNRALARTEAARYADEAAWDGLRAQIDHAIDALDIELRDLESRFAVGTA